MTEIFAELSRLRAQRSIMGKKIWSSTHPRNFGSDKVVRTYVSPHLHVSWGEICISSTPRVSVVNRKAIRTFREKKKNKNKAESFFRLNFNVYINLGNRERANKGNK